MAGPNLGGNYGSIPWLTWIEEKLASVEVFLTFLAFLPMLLLMVVQVIYRYVLHIALPWSEELIRYMFVAASFLGAALVSKERSHISIDVFDSLLELIKEHKTRETINYVIWLFADIVTLGILLVFGWLTYKYFNTMRVTEQISPAMEMPVAIVVGIMLLGVCLMILHYAVKIINNTIGYGRKGEV
jgi:TRAP-type C4-dicarboxylate transport system permease small subunit